MSIFVSIASYCDPFIEKTIESIFSNAAFPNEITIGIVDQSYVRNECILKGQYAKNIRYVFVDFRDSLGLGWARTLASSLYSKDDWYFQIDSHTVFDKNWDEKLVTTMKKHQAYNDKCILSSYPHPFKIVNDQIEKYPVNERIIIHRLAEGEFFHEGSSLLNFRGIAVASSEPTIGIHLSGGCLFTRGDFFCEIPYDPFLYFKEEEQAIAIRAFTHGWDIFHIFNSPVYHLYERDEATDNKRTLHWDIKHNILRQQDSWVRQRNSAKRFNSLVSEQNSLGVYGLGTKRSLIEYAQKSGIDYVSRTILDSAYLGNIIT